MASFNKAGVGKAIVDDQPAEGNFAFICTKAERHDSDNNDNLMAVLTLRMLKDAEDANSTVGPALRTWLTLPLDNDEVDGHTAPKYAHSMTAPWMGAFFPTDCADWPRKESKAKDAPLLFKGGEIEYDDRQDAKAEACVMNGEKALEIWGDSGEGIGEAFSGKLIYGRTYYQKGSDFPSVQVVGNEVPGDDWELSDDYLREVAVAGTNGKAKAKVRGKKKTTKKAAKKTRRRR